MPRWNGGRECGGRKSEVDSALGLQTNEGGWTVFGLVCGCRVASSKSIKISRMQPAGDGIGLGGLGVLGCTCGRRVDRVPLATSSKNFMDQSQVTGSASARPIRSKWSGS